jgi:hypothetical protein
MFGVRPECLFPNKVIPPFYQLRGMFMTRFRQVVLAPYPFNMNKVNRKKKC